MNTNSEDTTSGLLALKAEVAGLRGELAVVERRLHMTVASLGEAQDMIDRLTTELTVVRANVAALRRLWEWSR